MSKTRVHSKEIQIEGKAALSLKETAYYTGLSRAVLWNVRRDDSTFPKPIFLSKAPKFMKEDLIAWLRSKKDK